MKTHFETTVGVICAIGFIVIVPFVIYSHSKQYKDSVEHVTATVTGLERYRIKNGEDYDEKWIILTDKEVFENTDSHMFSKYNSSDVQASLKIEKKYRFKVAGWRNEYLSHYRNVIAFPVLMTKDVEQ